MRIPTLLALLLLLASCGAEEPPRDTSPPSPSGVSAEPDATPAETEPPADATPLPAVGSRYETGGSTWIVVAAGRDAFEYTAGDKGIAIAVPGVGPLGTLAPPKGAVLRVDPRVPMLWIDGTKHPYFTSNPAIVDAARGQPILLLELP